MFVQLAYRGAGASDIEVDKITTLDLIGSALGGFIYDTIHETDIVGAAAVNFERLHSALEAAFACHRRDRSLVQKLRDVTKMKAWLVSLHASHRGCDESSAVAKVAEIFERGRFEVCGKVGRESGPGWVFYRKLRFVQFQSQDELGRQEKMVVLNISNVRFVAVLDPFSLAVLLTQAEIRVVLQPTLTKEAGGFSFATLQDLNDKLIFFNRARRTSDVADFLKLFSVLFDLQLCLKDLYAKSVPLFSRLELCLTCARGGGESLRMGFGLWQHALVFSAPRTEDSSPSGAARGVGAGALGLQDTVLLDHVVEDKICEKERGNGGEKENRNTTVAQQVAALRALHNDLREVVQEGWTREIAAAREQHPLLNLLPSRHLTRLAKVAALHFVPGAVAKTQEKLAKIAETAREQAEAREQESSLSERSGSSEGKLMGRMETAETAAPVSLNSTMLDDSSDESSDDELKTLLRNCSAGTARPSSVSVGALARSNNEDAQEPETNDDDAKNTLVLSSEDCAAELDWLLYDICRGGRSAFGQSGAAAWHEIQSAVETNVDLMHGAKDSLAALCPVFPVSSIGVDHVVSGRKQTDQPPVVSPSDLGWSSTAVDTQHLHLDDIEIGGVDSSNDALLSSLLWQKPSSSSIDHVNVRARPYDDVFGIIGDLWRAVLRSWNRSSVLFIGGLNTNFCGGANLDLLGRLLGRLHAPSVDFSLEVDPRVQQYQVVKVTGESAPHRRTTTSSGGMTAPSNSKAAKTKNISKQNVKVKQAAKTKDVSKQQSRFVGPTLLPKEGEEDDPASSLSLSAGDEDDDVPFLPSGGLVGAGPPPNSSSSTRAVRNLTIIPTQFPFHHVLALSLYHKTTPTAPHLLVCSRTTDLEELELFFRRAAQSENKSPFFLLSVEKLDFQVAERAVEVLEKESLSVEVRRPSSGFLKSLLVGRNTTIRISQPS